MYFAILAGGVGTRLWPASRESLPKQFSDVTGVGRTMIQATVDRLEGIASLSEIYVITGQRYRQLVLDQLPGIPPDNIIVEPHGRNTGPAIGLACAHIHRRDPNAIIGLLHADHIIQDADAYRSVLCQAELAAQSDYLTVLGIAPTFAHTGYGYIKSAGEPLPPSAHLPVYAVERFLEKPDQATAEGFLADGGYYWNAGNFICRVERMLAEFKKQLPAVHAGLAAIESSLGSSQAEAVLAQVWEELPSISIDHGVMEHAQRVAVVPLLAGWNDVGSWDALEEILPVDEDGNCIIQGETVLVESRGTIVSGGKRLIALVGVEDLVVVDSGDALLVGHKNQIQKIKAVVERLRSADRADLL
ncbi:MAG: mannose-1-phosphate guanylyltransferase [Caldilineaceae bacterium]